MPPLSPVIQQLIDNMVQVEGGTFMMGSDLEENNKYSHGYRYSGSSYLDDVAWYSNNCMDNEAESREDGTHEVGKKLPNELGLFDMSGNVME